MQQLVLITSYNDRQVFLLEMPLYQESAPKSSSLNMILNLSIKGSSKLYSIMKDSFSHVLDIAASKWNDKTEFGIAGFSLGRSFKYHHLRYMDTYVKYIQFRTLHHRFYTNELLFKMGIKKSKLCFLFKRNRLCVAHVTIM